MRNKHSRELAFLSGSSNTHHNQQSSSSSDRLTSLSSASGANRRLRVRRRHQTSSAQAEEEARYVARFNHFDFLGRQAPLRAMDSQLRYSEPCPFFDEFCKITPYPNFDIENHDFVFVEANSVIELNHLERFNTPVMAFPTEFQDIIRRSAEWVTCLTLPNGKIDFPSITDLQGVSYYGSKFPGVEYKRRGFPDRASANDAAQIDAELAFERLMNGEHVPPHLNRMGGRGKLTTRTKIAAANGNPAAGRLVMMTSHRDLKINGVTEELLTSLCKAQRHPVAIGQSWFHFGAESFCERFNPMARYFCFDATKFDASLPGWLIKIVINILREHFVDGQHERYDAYWQFVYEGMVEAPMFLDNGLVFRKKKGTTSGHSHNTLIQSYCTLIIGYAACAASLPSWEPEDVFEQLWMESLGDDQCIGLTEALDELSWQEVTRQAWRIFRIDWSGNKSFETDMLVDTDDASKYPERGGAFQGVQFLGKYFRFAKVEVNGNHFEGILPYRPAEETAQRLLLPERGDLTIVGAWMRAVGHYMDNAGNPLARDWLEQYLDWLEPQVPDPNIRWTDEWIRRFTHGDSVDNCTVPCRRITYEEWLYLVLSPKTASGSQPT